MNQHRLVFDPKSIKMDYESCLTYPTDSQLRYQLIYQLSRITRDRGALTHDDRLDALAIAVAYWVEHMAQDANRRIDDRKDDLLKEELDKLADSYFKRNNNQKRQMTWM